MVVKDARGATGFLGLVAGYGASPELKQTEDATPGYV